MKNYLENNIQKLEALLKESTSDRQKNADLVDTLAAYMEMKELHEWQMLSPAQKQAMRITDLAIARKRRLNIPKVWNKIRVYSIITEAEPYIIAINQGNRLDALLELCREERDLIDEDRYSKKHVRLEKTESIFAGYFEFAKSTNKDFFPEALQKIKELYEIMTDVVKHGEELVSEPVSTENATALRNALSKIDTLNNMEDDVFGPGFPGDFKIQHSQEEQKAIFSALEWVIKNPGLDFKSFLPGTRFSNGELLNYLTGLHLVMKLNKAGIE